MLPQKQTNTNDYERLRSPFCRKEKSSALSLGKRKNYEERSNGIDLITTNQNLRNINRTTKGKFDCLKRKRKRN